MTKLNFKGELTEFKEGLEHIKDVLFFEESESGIILEVKKGDELYARFDGNKGEISYITKVSFFRMLTLFLKNIESKKEFEVKEKLNLDSCTLSVDVSRNGVLNTPATKKLLTYLASIGLTGLSLYMEDVFEVEGHPYFGYMRGRYSYDELKEIDDFAYSLGIEVFATIEVLGHMEQYLKYWDAYGLKDTDSVLLAGSEKTYEFLDLLIKTASAPFRSKNIGLAMDEAHDVGLGNYLKKFGYKPRMEIVLDHLNKVSEIAAKYGLAPKICGDMFFRLASKNYLYYDKTIEFTQDIIDMVPENVTLILWYYRGENPDGLVESLFENQLKLSKNMIWQGACWNFNGFLCEQNFGLQNVDICMPMCKKYGVKNVICTTWGDNGTECDCFYVLPTVFAYGEHMYNDVVTDGQIKEMFNFVTTADFDAFIRMSDFHEEFETLGENKNNISLRFAGKKLFWQDIMMGLMDNYLFEKPRADYYKKIAEDLSVYQNEKWDNYYRFAEYLCDTLSLKCDIAENLQKAYLSGDKDYLKKVAEIMLPELYEKVIRQHKLHKKMWHDTYKPFGFECIDVRYGGLKSRIETAIERISDYLEGRLERLEELEQKRLAHNTNEGKCYHRLYTASSIR